MIMSIRDERQREFADRWLESERFSIINAAPRFGKIFMAINILESYPENARVLITYPDSKIKKSWIEDFDKRGYSNTNVVFTTHLSIKKHILEKFDLVIVDEVHLLSYAQMTACKELFKINKHVLCLTGSLSSKTREVLKAYLGLDVLIYYSIEKAIKEGVIADYEINVLRVPLDNKIFRILGRKRLTEKSRFVSLSKVVDKLESEGKDSFYIKLMRMRLIQNSIAKLNATKKLLNQYRDERVLVFCGLTKIADGLGVASYHSKKSEEKTFQDFVEGNIDHLAVVKIGNTGVTYKPLNIVVINFFDSNSENLSQKILRAMSFEYNNPDKTAKIFIISSTEEVEKAWLRKALEFFDKDKIKYL